MVPALLGTFGVQKYRLAECPCPLPRFFITRYTAGGASRMPRPTKTKHTVVILSAAKESRRKVFLCTAEKAASGGYTFRNMQKLRILAAGANGAGDYTERLFSKTPLVHHRALFK